MVFNAEPIISGVHCLLPIRASDAIIECYFLFYFIHWLNLFSIICCYWFCIEKCDIIIPIIIFIYWCPAYFFFSQISLQKNVRTECASFEIRSFEWINGLFRKNNRYLLLWLFGWSRTYLEIKIYSLCPARPGVNWGKHCNVQYNLGWFIKCTSIHTYGIYIMSYICLCVCLWL